MRFPIAIHKDKKSDYGVIVPDLPGCFSAGSTVDEAVQMAREAILLHLEGMLDDGESIPEPSSIDALRRQEDLLEAVWAFVDVDVSEVSKAQRINITMPTRMLEQTDRFASANGETRSGLLVKAVAAYMRERSQGQTRVPPRAQPGKAGAAKPLRGARRVI